MEQRSDCDAKHIQPTTGVPRFPCTSLLRPVFNGSWYKTDSRPEARLQTHAKPADFESGSGIGVRGTVEGRRLALGNTALMEQEGVSVAALKADGERGPAQTNWGLGFREMADEIERVDALTRRDRSDHALPVAEDVLCRARRKRVVHG